MKDKEFIPFAVPDITEEDITAVVSALRSGWLTTGPNSAAFENEFSEFLGGGNLQAVAVNSATAGLHLAVDAIGIEPGDEVLVPAWTFTATAEVVRYMGATPVFVDVDPHTLNINLEAAASKVTDRTRAIIPVHFAGLPIPRVALSNFANRFDLKIIEDAAHAFPVVEDGQYIGSGESAATVFSFYATKTITTGEGGMLVTRDPDIAARARTMRLHGISRDVFDRYTSRSPSWEYSVVAPGFKYNLTDTAAAMGRVQLTRAEDMRAARQRIARVYDEAFQDLPLATPAQSDTPAGHAYHLYVLRVDDSSPLERDELIQRLADVGIGTSVHFIPLHRHPYWRDTFSLKDQDFPVSSDLINRVVSLPIFPTMTDSQIQRVVDSVRGIFGRSKLTANLLRA